MVRHYIFLIILVPFILLLSSCRHNGKNAGEKPEEYQVMSALKDSSYLFDGKTLNGWEIGRASCRERV